LETDLKYAGYIQRQEDQIARTVRHESKPIPDWVDFAKINGLRIEAVQTLTKVRPETLGQAARLSGVTPADIALLGIWIARGLEKSSKP
ncbi:MAG: tRNA uridine-5-carboxymethylaminomethyl(34) synthesis enzyme MnmG, partial [Spartobacteria bacterium]